MGFPPARSGDDPAMLRRVGLTSALGAGGETAVKPAALLARHGVRHTGMPVAALGTTEWPEVLGQHFLGNGVAH